MSMENKTGSQVIRKSLGKELRHTKGPEKVGSVRKQRVNAP